MSHTIITGSLAIVGIVAALVTIAEFPALQQWASGTLSAPTKSEPLIAEHAYATPSPGCDASKDPRDVVWLMSGVAPRCLPNDRGTFIRQTGLNAVGSLTLEAANGHAFSTNQSVAVTFSGLSEQSCAGIDLRSVRSNFRGYAFYICGDKDWYIIKYLPDQGAPVELSQGALSTSESRSTVYTLVATVENDKLRLNVNRPGNVAETYAFQDSQYDSSETIGVLVAGEVNLSTFLKGTSYGSVDVQDFQYLAL